MSREADILRKAAKVFERRGVSRTTIEDIAKEVGIKREAIYYYFKSREEILHSILIPQARSLNTELENILNSGKGPFPKLHAAIKHHLSSFNPSAYLEMTVALREDHFFDDSPKAIELRQLWSENGHLWTALIRQGQEEGDFNPELNPKMVAFGILGMCNWLARWFDPLKGAVSLDEIIEIFSTLASSGVAAHGTTIKDRVSHTVSPDARVPKGHPLRAIREMVTDILVESWDRIEALNAMIGQSSIPRDMLLRAMLLQVLYSIRSDRQLMEQLEHNQLLRWFVGLHGKTHAWDATVFAQNRERLLAQEVIRAILTTTLQRLIESGLLASELFSIDDALLQAWGG
ncbi:transposase [Paramagnetospirillum caucaseum]|uniref:Transposase n=1 Tax=Paramagnetospirillum caucaseum TaxID=1244869 RepID=M3A9T4_9PROT|nr:transposase [Paramagnetospirillum caucaseum]EME69264.1 transposase [Paramagnetospirillum caucaseum]